MRFWDSSGIVPLLVTEATSLDLTALYAEDSAITVWWGTPVECASAIARRRRTGDLTDEAAHTAVERLRILADRWTEVSPSARLRFEASRLVAAYDLRAADALQLAAALAAAAGEPGSLPFVCLDRRLRAAAELEGFATLALP